MNNIIFKKPELEDQDLISQYFMFEQSRSCERTFANVYLWSRHYPVTYAIVEDALLFLSEKDDGRISFAYPAGKPENVKKAIEFITEYSRENNIPVQFYNVTEENFTQLQEWYPDRFQIEYAREYADYVYEQESLATLAGKKLHAKRNHINKFKKVYEDWSYEQLSDDNIEECFQMALRWRIANDCEHNHEKNQEMCVSLNYLRLYKELKQTGGVLRVNGEVVAFCIGEELCKDTFVVHIEKAEADIDGAYPMINQQFVLHECEQYKYINREEDTGAEGLRKAKLSYRPAFLVEKGLVTEKRGGNYDI